MTGASGGLGATALPMFLEAGYRVAAVALDWPAPVAPHSSLLSITADLTHSSEAEEVVRKTVDAYGRLDCLVHLVGYFAEGRPVEETPDDLWQRMIAINLTAAFYMIRAAVRPMRAAGGGRIVIVGSTAAIQPVVTWSGFSAAMGGLNALVQVAVAELRNDQITVNVLHPSTIATPAVRAGQSQDEVAKWVDPVNLASLMLWLCSDAGRDVSGASIAVPARQEHPAYQWPGVVSH
jgi:NAD(P)-dependent dehydrogenase (short-subunit alcohol dehydrogenase family)